MFRLFLSFAALLAAGVACADASILKDAWQVTTFGSESRREDLSLTASADALTMSVFNDSPDPSRLKRIFSVWQKLEGLDMNGALILTFEARQTTKKQQYLVWVAGASPGRCPPDSDTVVWPTDIWKEFVVKFPLAGLNPDSIIEVIWEGVLEAGDRMEVRNLKLQPDPSADRPQLTVTEPNNCVLSDGETEIAGRAGFLAAHKGGTWKVSLVPEKGTNPVRTTGGCVTATTLGWTLEAANMPQGRYHVVLELTGPDGSIKPAAREYLRIGEPAETRYRVRNNTLYRDGKPYFPIIIYHAGLWNIDRANEITRRLGGEPISYDEAYEDIAAHGIDVIHSSLKPDCSDLPFFSAAAAKHGLGIVGESHVATNVPGLYAPTNLVFWYGVDEASSVSAMVRSRQLYNARKSIDPIFPVESANYGIGALDAMERDGLVMDGFFFDHYVVRSKTQDFTELGNELQQIGQKVRRIPNLFFGLVPQAFVFMGPEPTPAQLRAQVYLALVAGAKGINYYAYNEDYAQTELGFTERKNEFPELADGMSLDGRRRHWWIPKSSLWDEIGRLNKEIRALEPFIFCEDSVELRTEGEVFACAKRLEGKIRVIAVNPKPEPVTAKFGRCCHENTFAPYEVKRFVLTGESK